MNGNMTKRTDKRTDRGMDNESRVPGKIAGAVAGFARRAGGSLHRHPMPELREVSRELRRAA
jgi:hypothetical protein